MKIIAIKPVELFGTHYAAGETLDVTKEAAARLIRSRQARISVAELAAHLAGERMTTPSGKAAGMRVQRR